MEEVGGDDDGDEEMQDGAHPFRRIFRLSGPDVRYPYRSALFCVYWSQLELLVMHTVMLGQKTQESPSIPPNNPPYPHLCLQFLAQTPQSNNYTMVPAQQHANDSAGPST
jgi:hypothetical protein